MLDAPSPADYLMPARENPFVLVIEDDAFVGIELYEVVLHEGFRVVGSICTNAAALTWIANGTAALAIAAMKLNDGPTDDVMRTLRGRGVPFLIHAESEHAGSRPDPLRGVADQARLAPGRDRRAERSSSQVGPET